jgi:branched-subunit amino acid aminotransferase/4-amino-4-deoxychorismate lyase
MSRHIIYNGDLIKNEALFCATDAVLQGVNRLNFTWFVLSSALPFYQDEFRKIEKYANYKGIKLPAWMTANTFAQDIQHLFQMNRIYQGGLLKMLLFVDTPGKEANYLMTAESLNRQKFHMNSEGLKVDIFRKNRLFSGSAEVFDVGVSATETSAINSMYQNGLDQMVLLNEMNHVARFVGANFMLLDHDTVYTPAIKEGAIEDVMREKVIEACVRLNIKVFDDCIVHADDLKTADEIFVLDPVQGLKWVLGFEDRRFYYKFAPKLHQMLNQLYFGKANAR